jgi:hypothetical protein
LGARFGSTGRRSIVMVIAYSCPVSAKSPIMFCSNGVFLMRSVQLAFGVSILVLAAHGSVAAELPEGANRALVASTCTACHDLQPVFDAAGISRDDWNGALEEMTSYGLKITPEERAMILDYLATYLGPSAKK